MARVIHFRGNFLRYQSDVLTGLNDPWNTLLEAEINIHSMLIGFEIEDGIVIEEIGNTFFQYLQYSADFFS